MPLDGLVFGFKGVDAWTSVVLVIESAGSVCLLLFAFFLEDTVDTDADCECFCGVFLGGDITQDETKMQIR
jgi:hypothetical protein